MSIMLRAENLGVELKAQSIGMGRVYSTESGCQIVILLEFMSMKMQPVFPQKAALHR